MRKYYTLEKISKKATKEQRMFIRDNHTNFLRDSLNLLRMYFCLQPKFYYFPKDTTEKKRKYYQKKIDENRLKLNSIDYQEEEKEQTENERKYLESLLDEDDFNYKW